MQGEWASWCRQAGRKKKWGVATMDHRSARVRFIALAMLGGREMGRARRKRGRERKTECRSQLGVCPNFVALATLPRATPGPEGWPGRQESIIGCGLRAAADQAAGRSAAGAATSPGARPLSLGRGVTRGPREAAEDEKARMGSTAAAMSSMSSLSPQVRTEELAPRS